MEFQVGDKIVYTGGWEESTYSFPGVIIDSRFERCRHEGCLDRSDHLIYTAQLVTGSYVEGYPEQFKVLENPCKDIYLE